MRTMRTMRSRSCSIWVVLGVVGLAATALAKPAEGGGEEESERWIKSGVQRRREGQNVAALEAFLRAHRTGPSGRTLALVGLARQSLGQWSEAVDCLEGALGTHEPWVEKNRARLAEALGAVKAHVGWLLVTAPAGARLWINETAMGALPLKEIRLNEGAYVAKVEREGSKSWSQTVTVTGQKTHEVVAMLEQSRAAKLAVMAPMPAVDLSTVPIRKTESRQRELSRIIGAGLVGAGAAVAVVGATIWVKEESGDFATYNTGITGPALLVGGVLGMIAGGVLVYVSRERSVAVGMTATGPVVRGRF